MTKQETTEQQTQQFPPSSTDDRRFWIEEFARKAPVVPTVVAAEEALKNQFGVAIGKTDLNRILKTVREERRARLRTRSSLAYPVTLQDGGTAYPLTPLASLATNGAMQNIVTAATPMQTVVTAATMPPPEPPKLDSVEDFVRAMRVKGIKKLEVFADGTFSVEMLGRI